MKPKSSLAKKQAAMQQRNKRYTPGKLSAHCDMLAWKKYWILYHARHKPDATLNGIAYYLTRTYAEKFCKYLSMSDRINLPNVVSDAFIEKTLKEAQYARFESVEPVWDKHIKKIKHIKMIVRRKPTPKDIEAGVVIIV